MFKQYSISHLGELHFNRLVKEIEKEDIEERKLNADLITAERVVKTYGLTQTITWITFITVIILTALQIAEALKVWPYHK